MRYEHRFRAVVFAVGCAITAPACAQTAVDWAAVDAAVGRPSVLQAGDVHRFNFPRGDLRVMVGTVQLKPALALGGWVAMKAAPGGGVMAMGDLVLSEDEVTAVVDRLQAGGVEQTAIHHHVLHESPRVIYVHVHGHGDPMAIAKAVHDAVAATKIPAPPAASAAPAPSAASPAPDFGIDTVAIAQLLGAGRVNGGVYQINVARNETIREGTFEFPPMTMGLATAMNFQPTGGGKAAITGDFVMLGSEVNPVIRALRAGGIEPTSLHSHLLMEEPRLFFMHFWANADANELAQTLRKALDLTNSKKP